MALVFFYNCVKWLMFTILVSEKKYNKYIKHILMARHLVFDFWGE